nr:hypothetical protein [Tanacetum cinerariifolium]
MDNKKHIVNLESFRDMLHIYPRIPGQSFDELPFEEEILDFIRFLGHSAIIKTLTDVNINKLYQPWRSFAAIINKCLTRKSFGYDSFWLSQAQILWGLYYKRNIDYAFLIWEDFVYQVKNHKKSNEMYYPRFIKVIIHHFMSKDPSIPRRNMVNWHYVRDDFLFSTIKVVSRHQNTQQYGAMLPIELTNDEIRNTKAYKEYYAFATGEATPKPKASKQPAKATKAKSPSALSEVVMTEAKQLKLVLKRSRQQMHISQSGSSGTNEGTGYKPRVLDVPIDESEEELSWNSSDDEGADDQGKDGDDDERGKGDESDETDEGEEDADEDKDGGDDEEEGESDEEDDNEETRDEESFDPIPKIPKSSEDEGDGEEDQGLNVNEKECVKEEEEDELYRNVNINQGRGLPATLEVKDSHVTLTLVNPDGQQESLSVLSQFVTSMLNPTSDVGMESIFMTASSSVAPLPTSTSIMTPSTIATITTISQAPIPPTPIPSEVLQNLHTVALVFRFDDRLKSLEANFSEFRQTNPFAKAVSAILGIVHKYINQQMNKARIIKEQVKGQVKEQVSRILPRIEQSVNAQLEAEVLTRSSHSSRTSYAVAADLSEMELKKILIEKMEGNKHDDDDGKEEGPFARSDQRSKRRREGAEDQPIVQSSLHPEWFSQLQKPLTSNRDWKKTLLAVQGSTQTWISELAKQADSCSSFNELMDTLLDFSSFIMNQLRVDTLTPELLVGPTYELIKGSYKSLIELEYHLEEPLPLIPDNRGRRVIPFAHFINNDLEYLWGEGDFKRLRLQDIKDMLLLLVQGKLSNLTVEERFAFNVSLRMFKRSIVIQRRMEDLQLGVESYHKRLNLTKPDTYRSDLKRMEAYTSYSNPRGFIYQNKDKKNRLMWIDELYKFSDKTLNDVHTALDDRLKGIRMQYLP